jgi:hypothetical protein
MSVDNYPMAYDQATNIITVRGNETDPNYDFIGYDELTAFNFNHLRDYALYVKNTQGFDIIDDFGLKFKCGFQILTGSDGTATYFKALNQNVYFYDVDISGDYFYASTNTYCYIGELIDMSEKTSKNGCYIEFEEARYNRTFVIRGFGGVFSSTFKYVGGYGLPVLLKPLSNFVKVWNTKLYGGPIRDSQSNTDIYNVEINNSLIGFYYAAGTFEGIFCSNVDKLVRVRDSSSSFKGINIKSKSVEYFIDAYRTRDGAYVDVTDSKIEDFEAVTGTVRTDFEVFNRTTFNAIITNIDGEAQTNVPVKIYSKDGTLLSEALTDIEGSISDVLIVNYWLYKNNTEVTALIRDCDITKIINEPFTLIAEKPGYQTLTIPNITVTPGEPTIIRGAMVKKEPLAEDLDLSIGVELDSDIQIGVDLQPIEIGVEI